jgi:peptidoglycan/LPS O-acetylase OafA/YrhL
MPPGSRDRKSFQNIDLIRFVAATIVVIYHLTVFFPDRFIDPLDSANPHFLLDSAFRLVFNGPAAVMLFFIVSGMCINAPYRGHRPMDLFEFYTRRFVRIGIPLVVACIYSWAISKLCGFSTLPIWSLWCEMAYYLIYPALVVLIDRFGFSTVFAVSVCGALLLSLFPDAENGHAWHYGPFLSWIAFLPVWLAGVWISESAHQATRLPGFFTTRGFAAISSLVLLGISDLTTVLYFRAGGGLKYPLYLMLFFSIFAAIFIFFVVQVDLSEYRVIRFLERQGAWSYSLYLVHYPLIFLTSWLMVKNGFTGLDPTKLVVTKFAVFVIAVVLSIIFYRVIEKPSHVLAKSLGLKARARFPLRVQRIAAEI